VITAILLTPSKLNAYELTDRISVNGVLAGAAQCQRLNENTDGDDTCKAAIPLQPEFTYQATRHDRLFLKLGFAAGNGLNDVAPFIIPPWGADLEADVENINGSGRDHLLEIWYEHVFPIDQRNMLGLTLGIIDASQYLDNNAYANDEYVQFMNPALSNAPNTLLPSYDLGVAAVWRIDRWTFSGVLMDVHQNLGSDTYTFYGIEAGYRLETGLGIGNYRVLLNGDRNLIDQTDGRRQKNDILIFSFDQQLVDSVGVFSRLGWRLDDEPINYRALYSGGIDIKGRLWDRVLDNVGIGLAYLDGGNNRIINTRIFEAYYRLVVNPYLALTGDAQYMRDVFQREPEAKGFVYSLRATVIF
jgi:porin